MIVFANCWFNWDYSKPKRRSVDHLYKNAIISLPVVEKTGARTVTSYMESVTESNDITRIQHRKMRRVKLNLLVFVNTF